MAQQVNWSDLVGDESIYHHLIAERDTRYIVSTQEKEQVEMSASSLLINLILLQPLHNRGILPMNYGLYRDGDIFTDDTRIKIQNSVIFHPLVRGLSDPEKQDILSEFYYNTNKLSDLISTDMPEEFRSISMLQIAETMEDPKIKEILEFDPNTYLKHSLKALEVAIEKHNKKIVESLKQIKENNCFRPYLLTGSLNEGQFFQSVCLGGPRTDVDDTAVSKPITGNYINGLDGIVEYIIESFSARKSDDYNKEHMGNASYTKRKINLMALALMHIYPGYCGTTSTLSYTIPKHHAEAYLGRNIRERNGDVITLMPGNIHEYVDKPIQLYSPNTCEHTDGCCHRCGGMLLELIPQDTKIGQAATEQIMNPLQQSILSSKHLMKTLIQLFFFPKPLDILFDVVDSQIYLRDYEENGLTSDDLMIGVPTDGVQNISELNEFKGDSIPGSYFSAIREVAIINGKTGEVVIDPIVLENDAKIIPFFTGEFLAFLKNNKDHIVYNGDWVWFSTKGFDRDQPIMGITYVSEAAYIFIQKIEQFFARDAKDGGLCKHTSVSAAVYDLITLLWNRIRCNSLHVELLIKAALITSADDLSIPRVYDAEGVLFGQMPQINTHRTISGEAAFERWSDYTHNPRPFVKPSKSGLFDPYIGTKEYQHPEWYKAQNDIATY